MSTDRRKKYEVGEENIPYHPWGGPPPPSSRVSTPVMCGVRRRQTPNHFAAQTGGRGDRSVG